MHLRARSTYLDSLNAAQHQGEILCQRATHWDLLLATRTILAVTHDSKIPLQILAGPGSGAFICQPLLRLIHPNASTLFSS